MWINLLATFLEGKNMGYGMHSHLFMNEVSKTIPCDHLSLPGSHHALVKNHSEFSLETIYTLLFWSSSNQSHLHSETSELKYFFPTQV